MLVFLALASCSGADSKDGGGGHPDRSKGARSPSDDAPTSTVSFYLTGHGTAGKGDPTTNTVYGLDIEGRLLGPAISSTDPLNEPRGMLLLADDTLLVAASWKDNTHIARFGPPGEDGRRAFLGSFVSQGEGNPAMVHSYAIAQAPDGAIYVSNQDTATVTRYGGPASPSPGAPLPPPPSLKSLTSPPPGLFAASAKMIDGGIKDVRGITFGPDGRLYVADRGAARILIYDPTTGDLVQELDAKHHGFQHPIQPRFGEDPDHLYVSDNGVEGVLRVELSTGKVKKVVSKEHGDLKEPGALLIVGKDLYVGDRQSRTILRFRLPEMERQADLAAGLPAPPEFLVRAR